MKLRGSVIMYRTALSCHNVSAVSYRPCRSHIAIPIMLSRPILSVSTGCRRPGSTRPVLCECAMASPFCILLQMPSNSPSCSLACSSSSPFPVFQALLRLARHSRPNLSPDGTPPLNLSPSLLPPFRLRLRLALPCSAPQYPFFLFSSQRGKKTHHAILGKRIPHQPAQLDPFPLILARTLSTALDEVLVALLHQHQVKQVRLELAE